MGLSPFLFFFLSFSLSLPSPAQFFPHLYPQSPSSSSSSSRCCRRCKNSLLRPLFSPTTTKLPPTEEALARGIKEPIFYICSLQSLDMWQSRRERKRERERERERETFPSSLTPCSLKIDQAAATTSLFFAP
jgi:hypothetical protein